MGTQTHGGSSGPHRVRPLPRGAVVSSSRPPFATAGKLTMLTSLKLYESSSSENDEEERPDLNDWDSGEDDLQPVQPTEPQLLSQGSQPMQQTEPQLLSQGSEEATAMLQEDTTQTETEPRHTRLRELRAVVSEVGPEEEARIRAAQHANEQESKERQLEALAQQERELRQRRKQPYQGKQLVGDGIFSCPRCTFPNGYKRDACNKLTCGHCRIAFCVKCRRPASEACSHLYAEIDPIPPGRLTALFRTTKHAATNPASGAGSSRGGDLGGGSEGLGGGIIKLVRMENFKNHRNFELELGPRGAPRF